ncbi:MAG: ABC transporter substrate-binding protein [Cytophagales bacterium]|nr:ABC transporter substrate-binding protein [Cytophagales bacterium]
MIKLRDKNTNCFLPHITRIDAPEGRYCGLKGRSNVLKLIGILIFVMAQVILFTSSSHAQPTIKIGFLVRDKNDEHIIETAERAIREVNEKRGDQGKKFELIVRSCDGPWGQTSKQTVALIYEDQVSIVVTALDGRNAHLAEQVTAKSHVLMLSTISSDPTLSRAYVPWYFRMVPDDKQQANALVKHIYGQNSSARVAMVALDDYDGKQSAKAFEIEVKSRRYPRPELLVDLKPDQIAEGLGNGNWDAIVLAGTSKYEETILAAIKNEHVYAFLNHSGFPRIRKHTTTIKNLYSPTLDYVYDGIMLAAEAIGRFGNDSEAIRKGFGNLKYNGKTGYVEFDNFGNRKMD